MTRRTKARGVPEESGSILPIEVVSYSATILLIAALAAGWFDAMVPWR